MEDLEEYLKERGIPEETIAQLVEDKIDASVLPLMPDEALKRYLPSYSDRLAVVAFCRTKVSTEEDKHVNLTGSSVLSRLQERLKRRKPAHRTPLQDPTNTKISVCKATRRIELGWMNFESDKNEYKQVRSQNGGGTRHLSVEKDITRDALIATAKHLFFPDGNSKKGKLEEFEFELRDFQLRDVVGESVAELYERSKVKLLRLYMFSKRIDTTEKSSPAECSTIEVPVGELASDIPSSMTEPCESSPTSVEQCDSGTPTIIFNVNRRRRCETVSSLETLPNLVNDNSPHNSVEVRLENCPGESDTETLPDIRPSRSRSLSLRRTRPDSSTPTEIASPVSELKHVIGRLQQSVAFVKKNMINVDRQNVLLGAVLGFKRVSLNEWQDLDVKFSGESGIDDGGPSREFMRLCIQAIQHCSIFEGPPTQKQIALDYCASSQGRYELFAKILAYIIVHGGPVPNYFSESFYNQIVFGLDVAAPTLDDISDYEIRDKIRQLTTATDNIEFGKAVDKVEELVQMSGAVRLSLSRNTSEELAFAITKFVVIERKREVFQRFLSGLKTCGLLTAIRQHPTICRDLFVHSVQPLDARSVDALFEVQWSTPESNKHQLELRTQTYFRNWLQDNEDSGILPKLLIFVSGLDTVPPLGFHPGPTLGFNHVDNFEACDPRIHYPIANTCAIRLSLPIIEDYDDFCTVMTNSVQALTTFTDH